MADIVLFGGTTEGRKLADCLTKEGFPVLVSVATEYGESVLLKKKNMRVRTGRLDEEGIRLLLKKENPKWVIDATHPYAAEVSRNISLACRAEKLFVFRVRREKTSGEGCFVFSGMEDLAAWLDTTAGIIFSSLGAKEAAGLASVKNAKSRIYLRILPLEEGLKKCRDLGFLPEHIICMQGPFSEEMNLAMFHAARAEILLTKDSGREGGLPEKLSAAEKCGMTVALLKRPDETENLQFETALSAEEILEKIRRESK